MNALERGTCIFLLAFSVIIGLMSLRMGIGGLELMGTGFMPFLASLLLFVLASLVLLKDIFKDIWKGKQASGSPLSRKELIKPLLLVGGLFVYAFFLMPLGYLIMTFLLVFFMFFMMQPQKWRLDLLLAALVSVLTFVLFDTLLKVRLPSGIFTMLR